MQNRRRVGASRVLFKMCGALLGSWLASGAVAAEACADSSWIEMKTASGPVVIELFPDKAPATVANFLRYVDAKKLDGSSFYRAVRLNNQRSGEIPIEVVQGGQYGHELVGGTPMQTFEPVVHETTASSGLLHRHGAISMARAAPGSATSEFFISIHDNPALDEGGQRNPDGQGFAVFGQVRDGMKVVETIQSAATGESQDMDLGPMRGQLLDEQVTIESVRRVCAPRSRTSTEKAASH